MCIERMLSLRQFGDYITGYNPVRDPKFTMAIKIVDLSQLIGPKGNLRDLHTIDLRHTVIYGELVPLQYTSVINFHAHTAFVNGTVSAFSTWLIQMKKNHGWSMLS